MAVDLLSPNSFLSQIIKHKTIHIYWQCSYVQPRGLWYNQHSCWEYVGKGLRHIQFLCLREMPFRCCRTSFTIVFFPFGRIKKSFMAIHWSKQTSCCYIINHQLVVPNMNYNSSYYISIFMTTQHEVICIIPVSFFTVRLRKVLEVWNRWLYSKLG